MDIFFPDILKRIQAQFGQKSDAETARFFGITPQSLNGWKKTNSPDYKLVFEKSKNIDLHWLLTGERAPSSNKYSNEEMLERAEAKQSITELALKKTMDMANGVGNTDELVEEIKILRKTLKYL
jgi:hypothetical protein